MATVDGALVPLRARPSREDRSARVGMIVFIAGWTMMFGALLVAYLLLRSNISDQNWPPPGVPPLDLGLPTLATLVLISSSVTLHLAIVAVRSARASALLRYLVTSIGLAIAFLVLQTLSWRQMMLRGLAPTASLYAASFFGLTVFHALHAFVGVVGLGTLVPRARRGAFGAHDHLAVRSWGLYWHFVGAMWLVFYAAMAWT